MIGSFGNTAFVASSQQVRTFRGRSRSKEARFAQHDLILKKPVLEFIGPGLITESFVMRLDAGMGVNPSDEIDRLTQVLDQGEAQPMVIGGNFLGRYVIESMRETHKVYDNRGGLILADVTLNLKEYADDRV